MRHAWTFGILGLLSCALAGAGCRSEPTFVITFAPQDLLGADTLPPGGGALRLDATVVADAATPKKDAGGAKPGAAGGEPGKPAAGSECKTDRDCVAVVDGCCDCMNGGRQKAIPKAQQKTYETKRKAGCKSAMCLTVVSNDPSCRGMAAACMSGRCEMTPVTDGPPKK